MAALLPALAVFDLAGTTLEDDGTVAAVFKQVLASEGLALGWAARFDAVVCGDEVEAGRPSPAMIREAMRRTGVADPARVLAVGDTTLDLQAGTAAGAGWVVGVLSGAHDRARLLQGPHTHLLASVAAIPGLLEPK